ncbi:DUF4169 family protein [uncultured Sphingomonas sp.]|uniref:DUF4169 family protein n=1 Tax=uncultured Sphingomonas sp. TaxID=158754 RepID=UPI0035C9E322
MAEVVNLRRARKAIGRTAAEAQAAANRAAHGRTRAQKQADSAVIARRDHGLDGAKRDR